MHELEVEPGSTVQLEQSAASGALDCARVAEFVGRTHAVDPGAPLEDVSSWLHSLGCWEPEVRRRHDTLLQRYLDARGFDTVLLRSVRDAYWLAAACNSLSGALAPMKS